MGKKSMPGICHICGEQTDLTFEHVPPECAFNDKPFIYTTLMEGMDIGPNDPLRGALQRKGMGAFTLCGRCNNKTGKWYGDAFGKWAVQGREILLRSGGRPTLIHMHLIFPLRVLKQIAVMMFTANSAKLQRKHPDLVKFVLNRDATWLNPRYRFYAYYSGEGRPRMLGNSVIKAKIDMSNGLRFIPEPMSEITFPPFGYLMVTNGEGPPDPRMQEITHFRRYGFYDLEYAEFAMPTLPTHLPIPGDYRTWEEIEDGASESEKKADELRRQRRRDLAKAS